MGSHEHRQYDAGESPTALGVYGRRTPVSGDDMSHLQSQVSPLHSLLIGLERK